MIKPAPPCSPPGHEQRSLRRVADLPAERGELVAPRVGGREVARGARGFAPLEQRAHALGGARPVASARLPCLCEHSLEPEAVEHCLERADPEPLAAVDAAGGPPPPPQ